MGVLLTRTPELDTVVNQFFQVSEEEALTHIEDLIKKPEFINLEPSFQFNYLRNEVIFYILDRIKNVFRLDIEKWESENYLVHPVKSGQIQISTALAGSVGEVITVINVDGLPVVVDSSLKTNEIKNSKKTIFGGGAYCKITRQRIQAIIPPLQELFNNKRIGYLVVLNPFLALDLRETKMLLEEERRRVSPEDNFLRGEYPQNAALPLAARMNLQGAFWEMGGTIAPFPIGKEKLKEYIPK